jgi:transposase-like protein
MCIPVLAPAACTVSIRHGAEFKTRVVTACEQAGASIAAVSLESGVNAHLVHRWPGERRNGVVWADGDVRKHVMHTDEFKRAVVAPCRQPGVSMTAVACSHGLRPARVHEWIKVAKRKQSIPRLTPLLTEDWLPVVVSEMPVSPEARPGPEVVLPAATPEAGRIVLEISGAWLALGRKNYLFAGSDAGGERAAAIYSLIGTAKLNGLDPEAYLRQVSGRSAAVEYHAPCHGR